MMRWKRGLWLSVVLVSLAVVIGCSEWESSGDEGAWNDSYGWLDFSGVYADMDKGVLVRDGASGTSSQTSVNELIGTGDGASTSFSGALANGGVVEGSVLISAGAFGFVDDGNGTLTSPSGFAATRTEAATYSSALNAESGVVTAAPVLPGSVSISIGKYVLVDSDDDGALEGSEGSISGTFVYETGSWSIFSVPVGVPDGATITITYQQAHSDEAASGAIAYESGGWTINLQGSAVATGTPIYATYRYTETRSAAAASANTGNPIYTFNVLQTGEKLRIIDSNGNEYSGQLYDVNSTAGDLTAIPTGGDDENPAVGDFVASFIAEGEANGVFVELEGSFRGSLLETTRANTLFDRRISGTWRESGGNAGVFLGSTDPVTTAATTTTTE